MKFKGSLQDFYKKTRLPFNIEEQVIKFLKLNKNEKRKYIIHKNILM